MIRLPKIITVRLSEETRAKIAQRVGPSGRLKNASQFIREAIEVRLPQVDPVVGWSASRQPWR
jgi:Arc/MetJ-type ribon-helix-helix transcriptional regulator